MDLPEFKVDTKGGKSLGGGIIGGIVGSAVAGGVSHRGRIKEMNVAAGHAEHLMRVKGEEERATAAAHAEHAANWASHVSGIGAASRVKYGQFEASFHAPKAAKKAKDKDVSGAPAPKSSGAGTPAGGTPNVPSTRKSSKGPGKTPGAADVAAAVKAKKIGKEAATELNPKWSEG